MRTDPGNGPERRDAYSGMRLKQTDQIAAAAEVRGFRLRTRECAWKRYPFHGIDLAAALFCAVLLAAAIIL